MARYSIIVKADAETFLKYRTVNNLLRFTTFLDSKHKNWRWYNVFDKKTKQQLASFTNKQRPAARTLWRWTVFSSPYIKRPYLQTLKHAASAQYTCVVNNYCYLLINCCKNIAISFVYLNIKKALSGNSALNTFWSVVCERGFLQDKSNKQISILQVISQKKVKQAFQNGKHKVL